MKIYQFEITNKCNLSCWYCPRDKMKRSLGVTTKEIVDKVVELQENNYISLHHFGESLLEKDILLYAVEQFSKKGIETIINTNGILLTKDYAKELFDKGLSKINISYHTKSSLKHIDDLQEFADKITILKIAPENQIEKYKTILKPIKDKGFKVVLKRLRDLGNQNREGKIPKCSFLENNEFVVLWNGDIVPCCEVYDNDYVVGNIFNNIPKKNKPFKMCYGCKGYGNTDLETEQVEL